MKRNGYVAAKPPVYEIVIESMLHTTATLILNEEISRELIQKKIVIISRVG